MADNNISQKQCSRCRKIKSLAEFRRKKLPSVKTPHYCLICAAKIQKENRNRNIDAFRLRERNDHQRRKADIDYLQRKKRALYRYNSSIKGTLAKLRSEMRCKYGISLTEYEQMFYDQSGRCKICKTQSSGFPRLNVDHHHQSGKIRGLLCSACNQGLGHFKDSPEIIDKAREYLSASTKD